MVRIADLTGMTFGRLTVIKFYDKTPSGNKRWECECSCGRRAIVAHGDLRSGHTKSCGCLDKIRPHKRIHGLAKHPLRGIWHGIKMRCYNKKNKRYRWYGQKGVRMCDEWLNNLNAFYDWCMANGWQKGMHVDKDIIPKKLGVPALIYSPEMCSIVTRQENRDCIERAIKFNGISKTMHEWAADLGITASAIYSRISNLGWSLEKALTEPKVKPIGFPKKSK